MKIAVGTTSKPDTTECEIGVPPSPPNPRPVEARHRAVQAVVGGRRCVRIGEVLTTA